jgi:hypothetical protein
MSSPVVKGTPPASPVKGQAGPNGGNGQNGKQAQEALLSLLQQWRGEDFSLDAPVREHLPGKHDQLTHGHGGSTAIERVKTTKDLESAMKETFPNCTFTLDGLELEMARAICRQFYHLGVHYPETARTLNSVRTVQDKSYTAFASSGKFGPKTELLLNKRYLGTAAALQKALDEKRKQDPQWMASWSLEGVVAHEFGHLVYFHMMYDKTGTYQNRPVKETLKDWVTANKEAGDAVSGYARYGGRTEAWAEGFSQVQTLPQDDWSPYAANMHNFLTRMFPDGHPGWRTTK